MVRNLTSILVPPLAVCRYSCTTNTAPTVALAWISGLTLLGFRFFGGPHNNLISTGSLVIGLALIAIAITWARLTISQVEHDNEDIQSNSRLCKVFPSGSEKDPLREIDRLKKL